MSACVFCEIVAGDAPAYRVFEDERTLAFLDAAPATHGHTLVVPKAHRETVTEMDTALVTAVFRTVRRVASAIEETFDPDGLTVVQSNGEAAGQDVFHAHVHVVPRWEDDEVTLRWEPAALPDERAKRVATAIRDQLGESA